MKLPKIPRSPPFQLLSVILSLLVDTAYAQHPQTTSPSHANTIPRFDPGANFDNVQISEDTPVGSIIYTLKGIDPDTNATLTFGVSGEGSDVIQIVNSQIPGSREAKVRLIRKLDRESQPSHLIRLTLTDGIISKPIIHDSTLYVGDENDETPQFVDYNTTYYVSENAPPNTIIGTISARDKDQGIYGMITFDELDNKKTFRVETLNSNTGTGRIVLIGSLDYETQPMYQLRIIAVDGNPALSRINTATLGVVVQVLDTQDTPPRFVIYPSVAYVPESVSIGKEVFNVIAQDGDRGVPKPIQYSLLPSGSPFAIDSQSGVVYVSHSLDREAPYMHVSSGTMVLTVVAAEVPPTPGSSASVQISVIIEDVNDHAPQFYNGATFAENFTAFVPENSAIGALVTMDRRVVPRAFDPDQGINGTFSLSILGPANQIFDITPPSVVNEAFFMIRVKNSSFLDFEMTKHIQFTIMARETATLEKYSSTATVLVHIQDVNDHIPVFSPDYYEVHMKEHAPPGTHVLQVQAYDSDAGESGHVTYTNLQGKYGDYFSLDGLTGEIKVIKDGKVFDRETVPEIFLTVEARDKIGKGNRATAQIRIILDDINDKRPVFDRDIYEATLVENQLSFLRPLVVHATDRDDTKTGNARVSYAIAQSKYADHFVVNPSGEVSVVRVLNYEEVATLFNESSGVIDLQIVAFDSGDPPLSAHCVARIFLQDENDHKPQFLQVHYTGTVSEASSPGTVVVTVSAVDIDRSNLYGRVVYRIERGAQDKFAIDATSGVITVAGGASLDRDVQSTYELKVVALDGGFGSDQKSGSTQVTISVTDVNNKPPIFPVFHSIEVNETAPVGFPVARIIANDPDDSANLVYTLLEVTDAFTESMVLVRIEDFNYTACFGLRADGVLYVAAPLNREIFETVKIRIHVQDITSENGLQTAVTTINVRIVDINDNAPHFIFPLGSSGKSYENSVIENFVPMSPVFNIVASDKDKERMIHYSLEDLTSYTAPFLKINEETGDISLLKPVDREKFDWINFTVRATDTGLPPLSSVVPVHLYIIDVNDNNPNFTFAPEEVTIREDAPIGEEVTTVHAVDIDSGPYGMVSYFLDPTTAFGNFRIDKDTGIISVAGKLDRESRDSYSLVVNAVDDFQNGFNRASRKSSKTIRIFLVDINDNAPVISTDDLTGCIRLIETDGAGTQFYTIRATDADQPGTPNSEIRFRVVGGNGSDLFDVSPNHGVMVAKMALNNKYGNYTLQVESRDQGFPSLSTNHTFDICVDDFNDNAPVFVQPAANDTIAVWENATIGSEVLQLKAEDNDVGDNARIVYAFLTDQNHDHQTFKLNNESGTITLEKPLDRERQKQYVLFVEAHDLGVPQRTTLQRFVVKVKDVNDNEPIFRVARQEFHVVENYPAGGVIGRVAEALDEDDDAENSQTCYYIVAGNFNHTFSLDKSSRELRLLVELDRETASYYDLTIKATSNCNYQSSGLPVPMTAKDHSLMQVMVIVQDINDNPPRFTRKEYTAGVTVESKYGARITKLTAIDPDQGENNAVSYTILDPVNVNLNKEESFRDPPFIIDRATGEVFLNVKFNPEMKGYFDFTVLAEDKNLYNDTATVFIYLLRADQRVQFTLLGKPEDVRVIEDALLNVLSNITGAKANVDDVITHIDDNGEVNERLSDVLMHFVDPSGKIMDVDTVINLIDQTYDRLESVFKDYNIIEVQRAVAREPLTNETTVLKAMLIGITLGLLLLLVVSLALFCSQRKRYTRKLRAATALAFSSSDSTAGLHPTEVPGTNLHSYEGSNPVWMNSYVEKWAKDTDEVSGDSKSSIDENVVPAANMYEEQVRKTTFFGEESKSSTLQGSNVLRRERLPDSLKRTDHQQQQYNNIYETIEDKEGKYMARLESTEL